MTIQEGVTAPTQSGRLDKADALMIAGVGLILVGLAVYLSTSSIVTPLALATTYLIVAVLQSLRVAQLLLSERYLFATGGAYLVAVLSAISAVAFIFAGTAHLMFAAVMLAFTVLTAVFGDINRKTEFPASHVPA